MSDSSRISNLASNAQRAGLLDFDLVHDLATKAEKRKEVLRRVQEIYESAARRQRATKHDDMYPDPDHHAQAKCIELMARILDLYKTDEDSERRQADIQQVAELFRSMGWKVEPPRAA